MLDALGKEFDPLWMAEFRGFFWGEGCLSFQYVHRKDHPFPVYRLHAKVSLRQDDAALLIDVHEKLGGTLWYRNKTYQNQRFGHITNPAVVWDATGHDSLLRVSHVLEGGVLPSKKLQEYLIWREALAIHLTHARGGGYRPKYTVEERERIECLAQELHNLKVFKVPG